MEFYISLYHLKNNRALISPTSFWFICW